MTRAAKMCSNPRCGNLMPCPDHERKSWDTSRRRERTTSGWEQQRRAQRVMRQHDGICHVCGRPGADEVDHVVSLEQGGADSETNLRPIHARPCHAEKTQREAQQARGVKQ